MFRLKSILTGVLLTLQNISGGELPLQANDQKNIPLFKVFGLDCSTELNDVDLAGWRLRDRHLCEGVTALDQGLYEASLHSFQMADEVLLFEAPNYEAWPFIAYSFYKMDDITNAKTYFQMSELALKLESGEFECSHKGGFKIAGNADLSHYSRKVREKVGRRLCGASAQASEISAEALDVLAQRHNRLMSKVVKSMN